MSLTPEEWRKLDEAERRYSLLKDEPDSFEQRSAYSDLVILVMAHLLRPLIDAARPKCEVCFGDFFVEPCDACCDTGWAA